MMMRVPLTFVVVVLLLLLLQCCGLQLLNVLNFAVDGEEHGLEIVIRSANFRLET